MINAKKFKDEIIEEYQNLLKRNVIDGDGNKMNKAIKTIAYKHCGQQLCGASSTFKWLCEEYKEPVKLTRFEHDVLKHLLEKTQYRFIVREKSDNIYIYKRKPKKGTGAWDISSGMQNLNIFVDLFPFIKWEDSEPTLIEYVLKNCEVVDGESE